MTATRDAMRDAMRLGFRIPEVLKPKRLQNASGEL